MSNLEASFEIRPDARYKKMAREVARIIYKNDKFMRAMRLCDFAASFFGMLFISLLCVKFYFNDLGGLLEDYGFTSAAILPYLAWVGAFATLLYGTGLRPWLLVRSLLSKVNYAEFGQKSVILEDDFFVQKSALGEGRYLYRAISDARYADEFIVLIIANSMFLAVPREAFADEGAEFLSEVRKRAGLEAKF